MRVYIQIVFCFFSDSKSLSLNHFGDLRRAICSSSRIYSNEGMIYTTSCISCGDRSPTTSSTSLLQLPSVSLTDGSRAAGNAHGDLLRQVSISSRQCSVPQKSVPTVIMYMTVSWFKTVRWRYTAWFSFFTGYTGGHWVCAQCIVGKRSRFLKFPCWLFQSCIFQI